MITGLGVVTPIGLNVTSYWTSLLKGVPGVGPITRFDATDHSVKIAAEVKDFDCSDVADPKERRRMDRFVQYALVASLEAVNDAGIDLEHEDLTRVGVLIGSGIGGAETWETQHQKLLASGPGRVSPFFIPMMIIDMASGLVSIRLRAKGPNYATVSACASGAHALGEAYWAVRRGDADVMVAGGAEASVTPLSIAGFASMRALSTRNDDPARASRPFDLERDGFIVGEGSGIVVLEEQEHAIRRGARIYAEFLSCGLSADAYHVTAPAPNGEGAALAMHSALDNAHLSPDDIDYINAHGTSTELNDKLETVAIKMVFGNRAHSIPVSSTKSMVGHLLGAAGAVELVASVMTIQTGSIHPTINYEYPDPECDLDYVTEGVRKAPVRTVLSNSFGFGGHNVSLIIRQFQG